MFETIQVAVGCPGGPQRALLHQQAAVEANPVNHITIYVDCTNAFNSADRAMMLESVYGDPNLSNTWRAYAFCYSQPSCLLLRENGNVIESITSQQGGRQGCVLAGLGYAHLFQRAYTTCTSGLHNTTARAVMDDFAITGPPGEAFAAFAAFKQMAEDRGVQVNTAKTYVQQALGSFSAETVRLCLEHNVPNNHMIHGNHDKYLGGYVGVDDAAGQAFVAATLERQDAITRAIRDSDFPSHLAYFVAKLHLLPRPIYLLRSLPSRATTLPIQQFDQSLRDALMQRCDLPTPLPPSALHSLTQPVGNGGAGLRSLSSISAAAKWAAAVSVATDVQQFIDASDSILPFVTERLDAHDELVNRRLDCRCCSCQIL